MQELAHFVSLALPSRLSDNSAVPFMQPLLPLSISTTDPTVEMQDEEQPLHVIWKEYQSTLEALSAAETV